MLVQVLITVLALLLVFGLSWTVYHFGGNMVVFEGVSKADSLSLAGIETGYIAFIALLGLIPFGSILGGLISLLLPFIMVKAIKKKLETGLGVAIMVYVVAAVIKLLVIAPLYILT